MEKSNVEFQDLDYTITHVKRINEGGNQFPFIEYVGLYPDWDCNKWQVQLIYKGNRRRPFEFFTDSTMEKPNLNDILMFIFSKDTRHLSKRDFLTNNEYNAFFSEFGEDYGEKEQVERILVDALYTSGFRVAGLLYNMLGEKVFKSLRNNIVSKQNIDYMENGE